MINRILIGSDEGTYTVTNGARTITLTGLSFVPTIEQLAYVYNKTQDKLYYAPAEGCAKCTLSAGVITIDSSFAVLATGDIVHIQFWLPQRAYDVNLDSGKMICQNPDYAHTTSVETLVSESALPGAAPTGDAGGDADSIVDADGAFTSGGTAVGYLAWNVTEGLSAAVSSYVSATQVDLVASGVVSWASDVYRLPTIRRYEINMDTYNFLTLHYRLTCDANSKAFMKIYGTLDASATVDADTNWVDMSLDLLGSSAGITVNASTTEEDIVTISNPITMLKYMVKLIIENSVSGASTNVFTVFIKKSS